MILRQTFRNHFKVLNFALTTALMYLIIWWYFDYYLDILIGIGSFYLLFTLPSFYLHLEYAIRNAGEEITINPNEIIVRKHGKERRYSESDLAEIIVYKSASLDRWGMPFTAMEYYHYARIITKSGEEIIITCLLTPKVEEVVRRFSKVDYERRKSFFSSTYWRDPLF
jgi:uncharacterized membrane protein YhdT